MEECYGLGRSSCIGGRTASGSNRNFPWCAVGARPFYSSGCTRRFCVPDEPVDFGVGNRVDMGAVGSGDGFACASRGSSRPHLGPGCIPVAQATILSLVVANGGQVRVSVIIPTRNEAQAIGRVLADLPRNLVNEVIVVDNCSSDGTPETAAGMGARVISEPRGGYGHACLTGVAAADTPDVVVFLDGDYSDRPAELPLLLAPIADGRADITVGSRLAGPRAPGALPWHALFGNWLAASLIRNLFGLRISDLGPFRAARAEALRAVELEETTYGWAVELIVKGAIRGLRIIEVPVSYDPRIGKSKISGTLRGTIGAAWFILSLITRYYFQRRQISARQPA